MDAESDEDGENKFPVNGFGVLGIQTKAYARLPS